MLPVEGSSCYGPSSGLEATPSLPLYHGFSGVAFNFMPLEHKVRDEHGFLGIYKAQVLREAYLCKSMRGKLVFFLQDMRNRTDLKLSSNMIIEYWHWNVSFH